jgi:hypothetical protein
VLWKLRAIVYGGIAVVAALVLIGFGGGEEGPAFLDGRTAQGNRFTMELEDGRPVTIGARLDATCDGDLERWARWWSFDGRSARFQFDDGELRVREKVSRKYDDDWTGEREHSLVARVGDDGARGTMRYVETLTNGVDVYRCTSGSVSFSAG